MAGQVDFATPVPHPRQGGGDEEKSEDGDMALGEKNEPEAAPRHDDRPQEEGPPRGEECEEKLTGPSQVAGTLQRRVGLGAPNAQALEGVA